MFRSRLDHAKDTKITSPFVHSIDKYQVLTQITGERPPWLFYLVLRTVWQYQFLVRWNDIINVKDVNINNKMICLWLHVIWILWTLQKWIPKLRLHLIHFSAIVAVFILAWSPKKASYCLNLTTCSIVMTLIRKFYSLSCWTQHSSQLTYKK